MIEPSIIWQDENVLLVNKSAGVLTHGKDSLADWLVGRYPEIKNVGEDAERPGIVHRLDKETSGLLLVAKNQKSFQYLKKQFKERLIKKVYRALVAGVIKEDRGLIDRPIGVGKKLREAITYYKILERFPDYTYLELYPKTGRTHQIRKHLKSIGHPVVCDPLYARSKACPKGITRLGLHAFSLEFNLAKNGVK